MDPSKIASLFFKKMIRLCGMPKTIVSYRNIKFMSYLWKALSKLIGTKLQFFSACHPQTDDRDQPNLVKFTSRLVGSHITSWDQVLPTTELAYTSSVNRSTGRSSFDIVLLNEASIAYRLDFTSFSQEVDSVHKEMFEVHEKASWKIALSNENYKTRADLHIRDLEFKEGDTVMVQLMRERFLKEKYHKLHSQSVGPYKLPEMLGSNACVLKLPDDLKISSIFNVEDLSINHGHQEDESSEVRDLRLSPIPKV